MEDVPYARILREGWWIIVVCAIVAGALAYGATTLMPRTYVASSTLMLRVDSTEASLFERNQFSLARIQSYPDLVDSPEVVSGVRSDLDLSEDGYSDRDIRRMLSATNATNTVLLTVQAQAPTDVMAEQMANSAADHMSQLIESTENSRDNRYDVRLDIVLPAVVPAAPASPQVTAITGLGLIGGFALGAIIAVFRTTRNRKILTVSDVRRASGLPVVGQIPRRNPLRFLRGRADATVAAAAYEEAVGNMSALGGADVGRYALLPASPDALTADVIEGLVDAFRSTGLNPGVVDARTRGGQEKTDGPAGSGRASAADHAPDAAPTPEADEAPEDAPAAGDEDAPVTDDAGDAPEAEQTPAAADTAAGDSGRGAEQDHVPDADIVAACERLAVHRDPVIVVVDPASSRLIEHLARTPTGFVPVVRRGATPRARLLSLATKLQVIGIRPLGVLLNDADARSVGASSETWRPSDRHDVHALSPVDVHATHARD